MCVCTIHQNTKLMMIAGNFAELTANEDIPLKSYKHCVAFIICNPAQPACYLKTCRYCPGVSKLKERLNTVMDDNLIDSVQYKKWISVDRSTLETITYQACRRFYRCFLRSNYAFAAAFINSKATIIVSD